MKKTLLLLSVAIIALIGCKDKNNLLDPNAKISIRPEVATKTTNPEHLSAIEIVKQANSIKFWNKDLQPHQAIGRGFADNQRDTINVRLMMNSTDILSPTGEYISSFIEAEDMVFTRVLDRNTETERLDTIGYLKNATLRSAEEKIKAAHAEKDYATCYALFDEAFTFIPITAKEWRALKAKNEN